MPRNIWSVPVRVALWIAIPALGAYGLSVSRAAPGFSFAGSSLIGTTALLGAGWAAMTAGLVHQVKRPGNRIGPLLVLAGGAWFVAQWDSPGVGSSLTFSLGLALYAACPALVAHVTLAYPAGHLGSWLDRLVVGAGYVVTVALVGLAPALFFDPAAQGCTGCAGNLWLVSNRPDLLSRAGSLGVRAGLAWSVVAILTLCWRLVRSTTARRRVMGWAALAALAELVAVAWSYAIGLDRGLLGSTELNRVLWLIEAGALFGLAAAADWGLMRSRRSLRSLARLVVELDRTAPPGGLRDALADMLGDPDLLIAYRVGDDRRVDASAVPVTLPPPQTRATTTIDLAGSDVVLVHRQGLLDDPGLVEELRSAMHLGLENERLQAEALTQLANLRASRARIVEAGDQERRRLERDLHDGAQQHLVGVLLAIRLLRSRMDEESPDLVKAEVELKGAIADLRDLARGLYPVVLRDEGLAAAFSALGETCPLRVIEAPTQRLPLAVETTAYLIAARAAAAGPTSVTAANTNDRLVMDVDAQADLRDLGDLEDRISALGGHLATSRGDEGGTRLRIVLPIAPSGPAQKEPAVRRLPNH